MAKLGSATRSEQPESVFVIGGGEVSLCCSCQKDLLVGIPSAPWISFSNGYREFIVFATFIAPSLKSSCWLTVWIFSLMSKASAVARTKACQANHDRHDRSECLEALIPKLLSLRFCTCFLEGVQVFVYCGLYLKRVNSHFVARLTPQWCCLYVI